MAADTDQLAAIQEMWRREVEAAGTYRILAERETDKRRRDILLRLAECEDRHAASWSERIHKITGHAPDPSTVRSSLRWIEKFKDQSVVLHRLEQEESRVEEDYSRLMGRLHDPIDRRIAEDAMGEERDHATTLRMLAGPAPAPRSVLDSILKRERWHVRGTGWIGDAIYGVNDGLGAVFGIVSGMAGYTGGSEVVLAAGLAGTLASALSMGAGAYSRVEIGARGV